MDPDKALQHLRETARFILDGQAGDMFEESAEELAQQAIDLDEWLQKGGFLPRPWRRKTRMPTLSAEESSARKDEAAQIVACRTIHALKDGKAWSVDTLNDIAAALRSAGLDVRELGDDDEVP